MAEPVVGSTVPRRQLGRYLRDLRNGVGLSVRAAARQLERSEPTLWRIETGQTSVRSLDVEQMCRLYGAAPEMTKALMALAKETKAKGWWQAYADAMPEWFDLYVGLESAATRILWYEQEMVPGIFQTEEYARTVIQTHNPGWDPSLIDQKVRLRLARQAILRRPIDPPEMRVALDESVVRRPVGGAKVMAGQLDRLVEVAELPNVSLRVVPFNVGLYLGTLSGAFTIMRFPLNAGGQESEPPTVYAELFTGAVYLDKPGEVERYSAAFGDTWEHALNEAASRELMLQAREELGHG